MDAPTMDLLPLDNPPPAVTSFDYSQLDDAAANQAKAVVERFRERQKAYVIDTGRDLLAVKERLEHGLFLEWVQAELGMTPKSAQRAMGAAKVLGDKSDTVSYLPPTVLYELSAPSTPEPVRAAVLRRIEAGETVSPEKVLHEVREGREEARKRVAVEKEKARRAALTPEQRDEEDAFLARGQKRQDALARKQERDRIKDRDERHAIEAEARLGAAYLLDRLGAEAVATFFARFDSTARYHILNLVQRLAHAERARAVEPVNAPLHHFVMTNDFERLSPEEQDRARELAQQVRAGEPVEPVAVVDVGNGKFPRYQVVEGLDWFNALKCLLGRTSIPARIAPRVAPANVAAFGRDDGRS